MGRIGRSVKVCHLAGIVIVSCYFLCCILSLSSIANATTQSDSKKAGALTIVESSDNELDQNAKDIEDENHDDGIVSEESPEGESDQTDGLFEPSSEWKPIKKGQRIPKGLHVRLNLQTGEKEAKLMNDGRKEMNEWYAGEKMGVINTEKQRFTREQLKMALQDFKFDEPGPESETPSESETTKQPNPKTKKFRSYDELKKMMKEIELSVKTEAEIITEHLDLLKNPETTAEKTQTLLIDLEYYLHQFDNARHFCERDGMQILVKLMNNSEENVRAKAIHVLGSALQSNAKVQVTAIENGIMQQLLRMISIDMSKQVKRKSLFALSALLRQFPYAQKTFFKIGGHSAVKDLFSKSEDESLKIKIITLLTDLVQEKDFNSAYFDKKDESQIEKSQQYSELNTRSILQKTGWCMHLSSLLHQTMDHDNVEKVLNAMAVLKDTCQDQFMSLRPTLQVLSSQYNTLARLDEEQGETDTFFHSIHSNIEKLLKDIKFQREDL